jgi:hypothetical protein
MVLLPPLRGCVRKTRRLSLWAASEGPRAARREPSSSAPPAGARSRGKPRQRAGASNQDAPSWESRIREDGRHRARSIVVMLRRLSMIRWAAHGPLATSHSMSDRRALSDDEFRAMYPHVPNAELAALLGRSVASVVQRARRLGVRKDPAYLRRIRSAQSKGLRRSDETRRRMSAARRPVGRPTDEELIRVYPFETNAELAGRWGVSVSAVVRWARQVGVRKDRAHWSEMQRQRSLGRKHSASSRAKLSAGAKGRRMSKEAIERSIRTRIARGTLLKGATHPRWKGGRPWERFTRPEYLAWRNVVLERDNYTCQDCGRVCKKREKGLAAHHIQSYAEHPELRYDPANGVTLCRDCHMARHGRNRKSVAVQPCACGCGTIIRSEDVYGRPRRFVNGHGSRGVPCSEQTKELLREQRAGRRLAAEHRAQISKGLRRSRKRIGRPPRA